MPVKLIPRLRFLNTPATALQSIKVEPAGILSRFFPFNLNHGEMAGPSGSRSVSAWSFRSSPGGEARASKSLIEDEAELSDWVSGMRTGSLRGGRGTSDEEDDFGSRRGGGRDRGRGRGRGREGFSGDRSRGGGVYGARSGFDDGEEDRFGRRKRGVGLEYGSGRGRGREVDFGGRRDGRALGGRGGRGREGDYSGDEYDLHRGGRGRFDSQRGGRGRMDFGDGNSRDYGGRRGGRGLGVRGRGRESDFSDDEDEMLGNRGRRGGGGRVDSRRGGRGKMEFGDGNGRGFGGRRGGRALGGRGRGFSEDEDGLLGKRGGGRFDSHKCGRGRMEFGDGSKRDFGSRTGGKVGTARKGFLDEDEDDDEDKEEVGMIGSDLGEFLRNESESEDDEDDDGDDDGVVGKNARTSLGLEDDAGGRTVTGSSGASESYLSETRFDQCDISPLTMKAVKDAGYEKMTVVQEATLPVILKGKDVLAKAKTGTGKTVAFLLPSIEVIAAAGAPSGGSDQKRPPFFVLVICPTRELASQAAAEATKLLKYHTSIGVQVVIGGTRLALEQKRLQANPCQILVATPGRLRDHIENTAAFATRLMGVKVLVLDEADHLLDMGFRKDIENIVAAVPKQRQTLLFSATVPNEVRQICHLALKRDHEYINTVEEGTEETHAQVRQMHLVAPLENQFPILYTLLKDHIGDNTDYKVLVFCTTAMVTRLVADLLGELHLNVREIHSRKPQSYRTRVSEEFRKSKGLILVTSDVSARGVDYPDVTLVVQVGVPADRQQYIHRLGRTGRKGKEGEGILILAPWEEFFVSSIKDLPITKGSLPSVDPDTTKKVERALSNVEMKNKEAAYQAWLGYYNSNKVIGRDKYKLVELASSFSSSMGLDNPPALPKLVIGKMGLKNVPGLRSK